MSKFKLENVRLVKNDLFTTALHEGADTGKYRGIFTFPKTDTVNKKKIDDAINAALKEAGIKESSVPATNKCLQDGDDSEYSDNHGLYSISAKNGTRPTLRDRDGKTEIHESDRILEEGCYVNIIIDIWTHKNNGKGIRANLHGVQFLKEGDPIDRGRVATDDDFDDLDDDAEEM